MASFFRGPVLQKLSAVLKQLLLYAIVLTAVAFCWYNREHLARIRELSLFATASILMVYLAVFALNARMATLLLHNRGHQAGLAEMLVMNSYASNLGYATFFRAGYYSGKAWFYHKYYGLAFSVSIGLMGLLSLQVIGSNAVFGVMLGAWAMLVDGLPVPSIFWIIVAGAVALCLFVVLSLKGVLRSGMVPQRILKWLENVHTVVMATEWKELLAIGGLSLGSLVLQLVALGILFSGFGFQLPLVFLLFIAVLSTLSLVIALTPSNVGVRELVIWMLLAKEGGSAGEIVSVMLVDRLFQFIVVLVVSLIG